MRSRGSGAGSIAGFRLARLAVSTRGRIIGTQHAQTPVQGPFESVASATRDFADLVRALADIVPGSEHVAGAQEACQGQHGDARNAQEQRHVKDGTQGCRELACQSESQIARGSELLVRHIETVKQHCVWNRVGTTMARRRSLRSGCAKVERRVFADRASATARQRKACGSAAADADTLSCASSAVGSWGQRVKRAAILSVRQVAKVECGLARRHWLRVIIDTGSSRNLGGSVEAHMTIATARARGSLGFFSSERAGGLIRPVKVRSKDSRR